MIDFSLEPDLLELRDRVRTFVREVVIPAEHRDRSDHGLDDRLRLELQSAARVAGIFAPQVPEALGGLGLDTRGMAVVFEEAGYSILGPQALNCAAPDEGNMHMLGVIASPEQRERYLAPLAAGAVRSCFAMTEPAPGAGSDPSMLATTAERVDGGWSIRGASGSSLVPKAPRSRSAWRARRRARRCSSSMRRTPDGVSSESSMRWTARFQAATRRSSSTAAAFGDDSVLGTVGEGFGHAQVRLAPARLTHCMRWLGLARRALDVAIDRAAEREAFGQRLAELGMVQERIAQSVIDIEAGRALIWRCAWALDQGLPARHESSVAKAFVAEAVGRVVDRAVQICGSLGISGDLPFARITAEVRPFRIYDGPTETHHWAIARRAVRQHGRDR